MRARVTVLVLAAVVASVSAMAQTAPVPMIKEDAPPPPVVLRGATADTVAVAADVLQGLAVAEPDISARDEAPQPGFVSLKVLVSKTGAVEEAVVTRGEGELPKVAIAGVMGWTYRPYVVDGQAREIQSTIVLEFRDGVGRRARVRVSSGVIAGLMDHMVQPVYPLEAKQQHVQGMVVLHAIISKTGDIEDLQVVSGPPLLTQAAKDAVLRWKYRPYLLQGVPVEVETTINVNFTFGPPKSPDAAGATGAVPAPAATPAPQ